MCKLVVATARLNKRDAHSPLMARIAATINEPTAA
ncbi:MAG: hypothetical protein ACI9S9_003170 [Planctomycetota bacterium]|jgi:hypothetical protein